MFVFFDWLKIQLKVCSDLWTLHCMMDCVTLKLELTVQIQYAVYVTSLCALQSSKAQSSPFGIGSGHSYQTDPASYSPLSSPATSSPSGNAYSGLTNRSTAFGEFSFITGSTVVNHTAVWWRLSVSALTSSHIKTKVITAQVSLSSRWAWQYSCNQQHHINHNTFNFTVDHKCTQNWMECSRCLDTKKRNTLETNCFSFPGILESLI